MPLNLAMLLHGPQGAGKQSAVRAAAAALGMQVLLLLLYALAQSGHHKHVHCLDRHVTFHNP